MAVIYALLLIFALPGGIAWAARKLITSERLIVAGAIIVFSAAVPNAWMLYASQQADSITRAAGVVVVPFFFALSLIPAWICERIAQAEPKR